MAHVTMTYADRIKIMQLYYARAAIDLGSFSQAAAALGVTQPALSQGIAALERTLGGSLFDRTTRGVKPTALAASVVPHLRSVLTSLDLMLSEARTATSADAEPLRLGVSPIVHPDLVGRAFEAARGLFASFVVLEKDLADLRSELLGGRLDVMLVPAVPDAGGCRRREIASEPLHYLSDDPSAWSESPIELRDLSDRPIVMVGAGCGLSSMTRRLFGDAGARLAPYPGEADNYRSIEDWAHLGLGGAILPLSRFQSGAPTRPVYLDGKPVTIHYEAQWLTDSPRAAAIEAMLDLLIQASSAETEDLHVAVRRRLNPAGRRQDGAQRLILIGAEA